MVSERRERRSSQTGKRKRRRKRGGKNEIAREKEGKRKSTGGYACGSTIGPYGRRVSVWKNLPKSLNYENSTREKSVSEWAVRRQSPHAHKNPPLKLK